MKTLLTAAALGLASTFTACSSGSYLSHLYTPDMPSPVTIINTFENAPATSLTESSLKLIRSLEDIESAQYKDINTLEVDWDSNDAILIAEGSGASTYTNVHFVDINNDTIYLTATKHTGAVNNAYTLVVIPNTEATEVVVEILSY